MTEDELSKLYAGMMAKLDEGRDDVEKMHRLLDDHLEELRKKEESKEPSALMLLTKHVGEQDKQLADYLKFLYEMVIELQAKVWNLEKKIERQGYS